MGPREEASSKEGELVFVFFFNDKGETRIEGLSQDWKRKAKEGTRGEN